MTSTDPAPARTQLERARLDNRDLWRTSGIVMLVLLVIGIGIPVIPIVAIGTLLETRRNEQDARAGTYGTQKPPTTNPGWWIAAALLAFAGLYLMVVGIWPQAGIVGVVLLVAGLVVALRPWRLAL